MTLMTKMMEFLLGERKNMDTTITEFLDNFVVDPVLRLDVERRLTESMHADPRIGHGVLAELSRFTQVFKDPETSSSARAAIKFAANQAVLALLNGSGERTV